MELYIPPPSSFLPRLPPPRPVVPAVPVVPVPDLPEKVHAPEGVYTLNSALFPSIGTPSAPLPYDPRSAGTSAAFVGGAGGFMVPPSMTSMPPTQPGQTAMSFGSTVVNGQTQPAWPVKLSFISIYFPAKGPGAEKSFFGMAGGTSGKDAIGGGGMTSPLTGMAPQLPGSGYEPSVSSESSDPTDSDVIMPPMPMEVPLSAIPQQQTNKRNMFGKTVQVTAPNTLPRPKNNLRSSNSTFVTRLQALDNLPKIMAERGRNGGEWARWGFWNLGRTFGWGEEGGKIKEALARVTFSQVPTCHSVSPFTASPERVDIVVGFASGDLVWLDFIVGRYTRINKGGILNNGAVTSVHFDPRHPHHFIATFEDSTILQFNMFAEDPNLVLGSTAPMPWTTEFERQEEAQAAAMESAFNRTSSPSAKAGQQPGGVDTGHSVNLNEKDGSTAQNASTTTHGYGPNGEAPSGVHGEENLVTWTNEEFGSLAELSKVKKGEERGTWVGKNPIAAFKIVKGNLNCGF